METIRVERLAVPNQYGRSVWGELATITAPHGGDGEARDADGRAVTVRRFYVAIAGTFGETVAAIKGAAL